MNVNSNRAANEYLLDVAAFIVNTDKILLKYKYFTVAFLQTPI